MHTPLQLRRVPIFYENDGDDGKTDRDEKRASNELIKYLERDEDGVETDREAKTSAGSPLIKTISSQYVR